MPRTPKPTAKRWPQAKTPATAWRDRGTAHLGDGSTRSVVAYGATAREATDKLHAKIDALEAQHPQAGSITVTELFAEFLQHKRSVKGSKAKTIHGDTALFTTHLQGPLGDIPVACLSLRDLQGVQRSLTAQGKWRTAELATIQLKSLLTFAAKRYRNEVATGRLHLISRDDLDMVKRPQGVTRQAGELWTPLQVRAFLALSRQRYEAQRTAVLYPLFYTALGAGLRRGKLIGLGRKALRQRESGHPYLDITEQLVEYGGALHHETPKTAAGARRVPISRDLAETLERHMRKMDALADEQGRERSPLMFPSSVGTPLESRTIYRGLDTLANDLKLPRSTLRQLRKVYTSHITRELIAAGTYSPKLLARLLGHTSADVALSVYSLVSDEDYNAAVLELG